MLDWACNRKQNKQNEILTCEADINKVKRVHFGTEANARINFAAVKGAYGYDSEKVNTEARTSRLYKL